MSRRVQFFVMLFVALFLFGGGLFISTTKYFFVNFFIFAAVVIPAISIRLYDIWMNPEAYRGNVTIEVDGKQEQRNAILHHLMPSLHIMVWSSVIFGGLGFGAFQKFPILMGVLTVLITLNTLSTTVWNIGKPWAKKMLAHASTVGIVITIPILILTVYSNVLFGHSVLPSGKETPFDEVGKIKADFKKERIDALKKKISAEIDPEKKAAMIDELEDEVSKDSIWGKIFSNNDKPKPNTVEWSWKPEKKAESPAVAVEAAYGTVDIEGEPEIELEDVRSPLCDYTDGVLEFAGRQVSVDIVCQGRSVVLQGQRATFNVSKGTWKESGSAYGTLELGPNFQGNIIASGKINGSVTINLVTRG